MFWLVRAIGLVVALARTFLQYLVDLVTQIDRHTRAVPLALQSFERGSRNEIALENAIAAVDVLAARWVWKEVPGVDPLFSRRGLVDHRQLDATAYFLDGLRCCRARKWPFEYTHPDARRVVQQFAHVLLVLTLHHPIPHPLFGFLSGIVGLALDHLHDVVFGQRLGLPVFSRCHQWQVGLRVNRWFRAALLAYQFRDRRGLGLECLAVD